MSKKKVFAISQSLNRGLTETISIAENEQSVFRNAVVPLSRLELDPDNPRQIKLTQTDIERGIKKADPDHSIKAEELKRLKELAQTIEDKGLIQPIAVYKHGEKYRVVAGHRRSLAIQLLGHAEIEARVFNHKPSKLEYKLVQWIENTAREDLHLSERLDNLQQIIGACGGEVTAQSITANQLAEVSKMSLAHAKRYLAVLRAPTDVLMLVRGGKLNSLKKVTLLAGIEDSTLRAQITEACLAGQSLTALSQLLKRTQQTTTASAGGAVQKAMKGRKAQYVNLGKTASLPAVKKLFTAVLSQPELKTQQKRFASVKWNEPAAVTKAFKQLLQVLEE